MKHLIKLLKKYNSCFIHCPANNPEHNKRLERNIMSLGYDFVRISGHCKDSDKAGAFLAVISGTHYKESSAMLSENMLEICKKHAINSAACFKAGKPKGTVLCTDSVSNSDDALYYVEDNAFYLTVKGETFAAETFSDIADHTIRTASMYRSYQK